MNRREENKIKENKMYLVSHIIKAIMRKLDKEMEMTVEVS